MKFNQLFRYLIVAQAVMFVAAIVFGMDESASMPVELQEYYNKAPEIENLLFLMIMGVGVLIMYFVSIVKLYRFKNSGRILFLIVLNTNRNMNSTQIYKHFLMLHQICSL